MAAISPQLSAIPPRCRSCRRPFRRHVAPPDLRPLGRVPVVRLDYPDRGRGGVAVSARREHDGDAHCVEAGEVKQVVRRLTCSGLDVSITRGDDLWRERMCGVIKLDR